MSRLRMVPTLPMAPGRVVMSFRLRQDVDILVYIEHPTRELDLTCLLRHLLQRDHGLKLEVASKHFRDYEALRRFNPKIICVNGFFVETKGFFRQRYFWPNAQIVNLAYEQLITKINEEIKMPVGNFARTELKYSAWGDFFVKILERRGVPASLAKVNGNPIYGMYRQPYLASCPNKEEVAKQTGLDPSHRWVFIPENYQAAFFGEGRKKRYLEVGMQEADVEAFCQFAERSLKSLCEWLHHVPEGVQVILRPRPIVGMEKFMAKVDPWLPKDRSRILVSTVLTAKDWVPVSDVTLSSYSTTLLEAAVAGKQAAMLKPEPFPDWVGHEWYDYAEDITTLDEFVAVLKGDSTTGNTARLAEWTDSNLMAHGDPVKNMVEWLAQLVKEHDARPKATHPSVVKSRFWLAWARENLDYLKWSIRGGRERARPGDFFDDSDVVKGTEKWQRLLGNKVTP